MSNLLSKDEFVTLLRKIVDNIESGDFDRDYRASADFHNDMEHDTQDQLRLTGVKTITIRYRTKKP